jgi:membrane protein YqaA with SNARE-associated domain
MRAFSRWLIGLFASPVGIVVLAALDSTVFFSFPFGIDVAVILMAARRPAFAWVVALLAVSGSVAGAAFTLWTGSKIGEKGLDRFIPSRRLKRVRERARHAGAITIAALDLAPPPFPWAPLVMVAGALDVDRPKFFITLVICRFVRFGGEALLAVLYGRSIVRWLESEIFHQVVSVAVLLAIVVSIFSAIKIIRSARRPAYN